MWAGKTPSNPIIKSLIVNTVIYSETCFQLTVSSWALTWHTHEGDRDFKYRTACIHSLHDECPWTETLHSNIKKSIHHQTVCVSPFLCIQATNVMLALRHTGQPTSLSLCSAYVWQGHNRVADNRPLYWVTGSEWDTSPIVCHSAASRSPKAHGQCQVALSRDGEAKTPAAILENLGEVTEVNIIKRHTQNSGEGRTGDIYTPSNINFISWF